MDDRISSQTETRSISFDDFWTWLSWHYNCIVRAAHGSVIVYDDDDLHWHLGVLDDETVLVQTIRGKHAVAEIELRPTDVLRVDIAPLGENEVAFQLVSEVQGVLQSVGYFVLSHDFDADELREGAPPTAH